VYKGFWLESLYDRLLGRSRDTWEDSVNIYVMEMEFWGCRLVLSGSGRGQLAGYGEHCNEPSDSINGREFLDWLCER
jgi:hypothetical protein